MAETQQNAIVARDVTEAKPALPAAPAASANALAARLSASQQAALAAMSGGSTIRGAAQQAGVCRATVYNWIERDPMFRAAYNAWQRELHASAYGRLLKTAESAVDAIAKRIEKGDHKLGMELVRRLGILEPRGRGPTDPELVRLDMRVRRKRRERKIKLQGLRHELSQTSMSRQQQQRFIDHYVLEQGEEEEKRPALGAPSAEGAKKETVQSEGAAADAAKTGAAGG